MLLGTFAKQQMLSATERFDLRYLTDKKFVYIQHEDLMHLYYILIIIIRLVIISVITCNYHFVCLPV